MTQIEYTPLMLTPDSTPNQLKQCLLYVITAYRFAEQFIDKYRTYKFRQAMSAFANKPDLEQGNHGGVSYVESGFKDIKEGRWQLEPLTLLIDRVSTIPTVAALQEAASLLDCNVPETDKSPQKQQALADSYRNWINKFSYCQFLVEHKWPAIHEWAWSFEGESTPSSPKIPTFIATQKPVSAVHVFLTGEPKLPQRTPEFSGTSLQKTKGTRFKRSRQESQVEKPREEYCLAHYLNAEQFPSLATVTLFWQDQKLTDIIMHQQKGFRRGLSALSFKAIDKGIINGGLTYYVVLEQFNPGLNQPPFQIQISIEKQAIHGQRSGLYTTIMYESRKADRSLQVSGAVTLQTITGQLTDTQLDQIAQYILDDKATRPKGVFSPRICQESRSIRYRLLGQLVHLVTSADRKVIEPWQRYQRYVGKYICYYMRLAKSPVMFETSHIELFPDGSAQLIQPQESRKANGYARIDGTRLWLFFDLNTNTGHEPIRFLVDDVHLNLEPQLRGIFSSETSMGRYLVSGRMSMHKLPAFSSFPDKGVSIRENDVVFSNFIGNDLVFFTNTLAAAPNLTDGPIWADVAHRLVGYSAFRKLEKLCTDPKISKEPFNNNQFYYYTFKADPNDAFDEGTESKFIIERNLVTFLPNGKVTIHVSPSKFYTGYAYYQKNTLRLSLTEPDSGFFELFLELSDDTHTLSTIKILYGMSLWHSARRLQGKMVVLTRYGEKPFSTEAGVYRFTPEEHQRLMEEDKQSRGAISYLRGELNRYMHATTDSSPEQFRPRDRSFREIHFLIACFYGYQVHYVPNGQQSANRPGEDVAELCRRHLRHAYMHGFACPFAGLTLTPKQVIQHPDQVSKAYSEQLLTHLTDQARRQRLEDDTKTIAILKRIRQIAEEQLYFKEVFAPGGCLDIDHIRSYAQLYWKELLPE